MIRSRAIIPAVACGLLAGSALRARAAVTTFDNGTEGWSVSGRDDISQTGGNPGANMDVEVLDVFGISIRNDTNGAFLGDFGRFGSQVELSVDVNINSIWMFDLDGNPFEVPRNLVVELVDYNEDPENPYPYTSVWFNFGEISADLPGWRNFSITVDPNATELPSGWGGTGDEDPETFEPRLPADRTFASVMASVEEIRFTSLEPGWFFAFTNFDLQVDNPSVTAVPEPVAAFALLALPLALLRRRR